MSIINGSGVAHIAAETLRKAIPHAADHLGCNPSDVSFVDGLFLARDSNLTVGLEELVIRLARRRARIPMTCIMHMNLPGRPPSHGCHVVEMEVDPATCLAQVQRYTVVDDFGVIINPVTGVAKFMAASRRVSARPSMNMPLSMIRPSFLQVH